MASLPGLGILSVLSAAAAALLLVGLWTPVAGVAMAAAELGFALSHAAGPANLHAADPWMHILHGALGVALAMLGPGAWSVDARLFGRKRIQIQRRSI